MSSISTQIVGSLVSNMIWDIHDDENINDIKDIGNSDELNDVEDIDNIKNIDIDSIKSIGNIKDIKDIDNNKYAKNIQERYCIILKQIPQEKIRDILLGGYLLLHAFESRPWPSNSCSIIPSSD